MSLPLRIYTDTSVFGGCFDTPFADASKRFFSRVKQGRYLVLISDIVALELTLAPPWVQQVLASLDSQHVETCAVDRHVQALANAYLQTGTLNPKWANDATHVAVASLTRADAIISWNFKHIVRLDRMKVYNAVNLEYGLPSLNIISPLELDYGDQDE